MVVKSLQFQAGYLLPDRQLRERILIFLYTETLVFLVQLETYVVEITKTQQERGRFPFWMRFQDAPQPETLIRVLQETRGGSERKGLGS